MVVARSSCCNNPRRSNVDDNACGRSLCHAAGVEVAVDAKARSPCSGHTSGERSFMLE
jgi:hypothetical protein